MTSQEANKKAQEQQEMVFAESTGAPFKTEEAARSAQAKKNLRSSHVIVKTEDGGYALQKKPPKPEEEYFRVRFQAKSRPGDTDDVQLMVNGETLIIKREATVIVPGKFLECADHATYNQYKSVPGNAHKIVGKIKTYPYERLGEATESEFEKARTEGTRKVRSNIKRFGFDVAPEDVDEDTA